MELDDLDVVRSIEDAHRPLSTYEVARGLGVSRDTALQALMSAHRARYLMPIDSSEEGVVRWQLTAAGARYAR